tara:strand:- start:3486 stop:4220 length:735 start_codon:yes stop_codon:yes gene_type:complete
MNTNEQIKKFIDTSYDDFVPTYNNIQFLHNYTGCNDYRLSNILIKSTWDYIVSEIFPTSKSGITSENPNYIKCLHTNSGAGKFLELAPQYLDITSFNTDKYCSFITDAVCNDRASKNLYNSYIRDLSDYFVATFIGDNDKYNIVITQPFDSKKDKVTEDEINYNEIDYNTEYSKMPPLEYYPKRAAEFLYDGGILCVVVGGKNNANVKNSLRDVNGLSFIKEISFNNNNEYQVLIYKKGNYGNE